MIITKKINTIFKNKFIELQNNIVENKKNKKIFEHIKLIENESNNPGSIIIVEYKKKFLIINLYRYGLEKFSWELPRGYKNKNESLLNCAIRELKEETGIILSNKSNIIEVGKIAINSSFIASELAVFLIKITSEPKINLHLSENIINYEWLTLTEIFQKIKDNKIIDSITISAFTLFFTKSSLSN